MKCSKCGHEGDFPIIGAGMESRFECPLCREIPTLEKTLKAKEKRIAGSNPAPDLQNKEM